MRDPVRKIQAYLDEVGDLYASAPARGVPSLATDIVVAGILPETGKATYLGPVLPLAILMELSHEGRLEVSPGRKVSVTVRDPTPLGDPELDEAMVSIGSGAYGHQVSTLLEFLPDAAQLLGRLVAAGALVEESGRRWGVLPNRRYRPTTTDRDAVVARVRSVLLGESVPDERTALLISLVRLTLPVKVFVPKDRVKEADRRLNEIGEQMTDDQRTLLLAVQKVMSDANAYTSSV